MKIVTNALRDQGTDDYVAMGVLVWIDTNQLDFRFEPRADFMHVRKKDMRA